MKNLCYAAIIKKSSLAVGVLLVSSVLNLLMAQTATVSMPVALGSPCNISFGSTANDSVKVFQYNATTNILTHRSNCKPALVSPPGFTDELTGISYNQFDGNYYLQRVYQVPSTTRYDTYIFKWNPTTCPGPAALGAYAVFQNQFVAGLEFDPATGLAYQLNFVDTSGPAPSTVDADAGNVGQGSSMVVLSTGVPAVAYFDATTNNVKYARAKDPDGFDWHLPVNVAISPNVSRFISMAIVNGNPAICYYNPVGGDLMYVRATNAAGTAWGAPIIVDGAVGNVGSHNSLKIVNGNPAISYYDITNTDLKYIRATNADGSAWGTPVAVAVGSSDLGQYSSLEVVNGNPAIAFYDATAANRNLMYVRATDANGTAWAAAITVESTNDVGSYAALKVVNGNPAIAHYDVTNADPRYIRATDANGTAWGTPVAITTAGTIGSYLSMETVSGNPAISYYDATNSDLKYVRSNDATGTAWGTPATPEAAGNIGQYTSMLVMNGNPAIAYYDVTNANAKYIRSYDNVGKKWYKNTGVYNMHLQRINFVTGLVEESKRINYGNRYIYTPQGDLVLTPDGKYLAIFNNKYFSINWKDYNSGALVATHIDTMILPSGTALLGLAYSDGKLVAAANSGTRCNSSYKEVDIITGALSNITYSAGSTASAFVAADMANIPTGVGAAKKLTSATAVSAGVYDLEYEILVKNYGGNALSNIQIYDTLSNINGAANVVSRNITSLSAPPGFSLNSSYDGVTAGNMNLLSPSAATLSNVPGQNEIRIRMVVRISGIVSGVVYNNQATVTATNIYGDPLRDLSTDGDKPDKNNNARPDDIGEGQPTPFIVQLTGSTLPCLNMTKVLFEQTFGTAASATALNNTIPAPVLGAGVTLPIQQTGYNLVTVQPLDIDDITLTADAINANTVKFVNLQDHTPADVNGQMMVVNADASSKFLYRGGFTFPLCANQQYSLSFYTAFTGNTAYGTICSALNTSGQFVYPRIKIRIRDAGTGLIITEVSTGSIISTSWQQFGVKFLSPSSYTGIIFELINDADGGCGNDLAIDDIQFGSCDPSTVISVTSASGCVGESSNINGVINDLGAISGTPEYQWQVSSSSAGPFTDLVNGGNVSGATTPNLVLNPLGAADTAKYYRLLVSAAGNITNTNCRFNSNVIFFAGKKVSVAATSVAKSKSKLCPGVSVDLTQAGGSLGANATWKWYTGGCNSTLVGTGSTITVSPTVTTTYYVRAEGDCNITACIPVTVTVNCDIDKDNDAIPDFVESNISASFADANSDGVINAYDPTYAGFVDTNGDFVNDNFQADGDSDNDGTANYLDTDFAGRIDTNGDGIDDRFDQDKDGIINMLDADSDNDGIPDVVEAWGVDTNGDAVIDNYTDTDVDGLSDNVDTRIVVADGAYNTGVGLNLINIDGDVLPNFLDTDSDNDGIPDIREVLAPDANNNGMTDGFIDLNSDGLHDSYINAGALLRTGADVNGDGRADSWPNKNFDRDLRPNAYDLDSDGDGIADVIEAGGGIADTDFNGLADGTIGTNGWSTSVSVLPTLTLRNTETVGNADYLDIDSDGDGIPDNIEGMSTLSYQLPTTTDTDGDGIMSPYDNLASFGGSGIFVYDNDGDGTPDYRDLDTDNDGSADLCEGHDWNLNGICDEPLVITGLDADGDGLDNLFDSLNSVTNLKGTSYMMGNGGTFTGDAAPGTKATVQRTFPAQGDRDWRWAATVLPVQFLGFTGVLKNDVTYLQWSVIASEEVDRYEVERSTDNSQFTLAGTVKDKFAVNVVQNFSLIDGVSSVTQDVIYYRLKAIGKNGVVKYSNVIVVRKTHVSVTATKIYVSPNPANNYVNIKFFAEKAGEITIRLVDNLGKIVLLQKQKAVKGNNEFQLNQLVKYADGVYSVQVFIDGSLSAQKILLSH